MMDTRELRGGVEIDPETGVRMAAHIRRAEPYDWHSAIQANSWERVPFEDDDGWTRVIHDFDRDRVGQHRGMTAFAPIMSHAKMLARYYGIELQQATLAASLGIYTKSPYDPALIADAMGADDGASAELNAYQQLRADWSQERPVYFNGARVPPWRLAKRSSPSRATTRTAISARSRRKCCGSRPQRSACRPSS
jgi:capsid protein